MASKRILFSSYHNYLDQGSGAAISVRALLLDLASKGWEIRTLTGPFFDDPNFSKQDITNSFLHRGFEPRVEKMKTFAEGRAFEFSCVRLKDSTLESTVFLPKESCLRDRCLNYVAGAAGKVFLKLFVEELRSFQPNIYLTYGGYWAATPMASLARRYGTTNVFYLCNFSYDDKRLFNEFDSFIVPSTYSQIYYKKRLGIDSIVVPPLIDESRFVATENSQEYLTFINPSLEKGVYFFAGIARELNRRRPDIPILVVEGRSKVATTAFRDLDFSLTNLRVMSNVSEPRLFYSRTRIVVMPSLWQESFGRVAVEAALNKIPVMCSNRGALPEIISESICVLDIPGRFTPYSRMIPDAQEVRPWVERIIELWDSMEKRKALGEKLRKNALRFSYEITSEKTNEAFTKLATARKYSFKQE